ncbi:MAG TPA: hypothetical protein VGK29_15425 [Paludibaculum sp.]|jgi:hypothetical protein
MALKRYRKRARSNSERRGDLGDLVTIYLAAADGHLNEGRGVQFNMLKRAAAVSSQVLLYGIVGFVGGLLANLYHPTTVPLSGVRDAVIAARQFQVIDQRGRKVANLSESGLSLFGEDGRARATLRLQYNDKGILEFSDSKREGRAVFGMLGTDTPSDKDDNWGLMIQPPEAGSSVVFLGTEAYGSTGVLIVGNKTGRRTVAVPQK